MVAITVSALSARDTGSCASYSPSGCSPAVRLVRSSDLRRRAAIACLTIPRASGTRTRCQPCGRCGPAAPCEDQPSAVDAGCTWAGTEVAGRLYWAIGRTATPRVKVADDTSKSIVRCRPVPLRRQLLQGAPGRDGVGVVGAEDALADGEGAFEEGAGGGGVALVAE